MFILQQHNNSAASSLLFFFTFFTFFLTVYSTVQFLDCRMFKQLKSVLRFVNVTCCLFQAQSSTSTLQSATINPVYRVCGRLSVAVITKLPRASSVSLLYRRTRRYFREHFVPTCDVYFLTIYLGILLIWGVWVIGEGSLDFNIFDLKIFFEHD